MRKLLHILAVLALAGISYAQGTPGIAVTATLVDGQGNIEKTGFLHFELFNCGTFTPQIVGNPTAIVAKQFDLHPDPTSGLVSGSIYGNNQIYCGNVLSTQWVVTLYKATGQVGIPAQNYCLTAPGTFDPSVNQPCTTPPAAPGFQYLFGNPLNPQTWTQPAGTIGTFVGSFDFSQAQITGLNVGATPAGGDDAVQFSLSNALAGNPFFTFNPLNSTLTIGSANPAVGTSLSADANGYLTTSLVPPFGDNSNRLATTSDLQALAPNWNNLSNKPATFPPSLPTTTTLGGVFMPADCPLGSHVFGINNTTGQLKCAPDLAPSITLETNGVVVGSGLNTFNFVASAGLTISAAVNNTTGVVTFTITGSTATQAQIPSFSPLPGAYSTGQNITMTCASPSPTIYYTTNGTTPTHGSTVYSTPVAVTNTTLEAICASAGLADSNVQTGVYSLTAPAVTLSTASLNFGNQIVGTPSAYQSFTITNTGTATLTFTSIVSSGDYSDTTDCGGTLNAGALCTVNVLLNATTTGTRTGTVTITDNATGSPQSVSLTGVGVQPTATPAPASLTFASQTVNTTSAAQVITVTNSSAFPLTVSGVTLTGANANQFAQTNNCTTVAGSGGTCTINVTFSPTSVGSFSASVSIADNASGSPQTVALSGTGANAPAPATSLSPTSLTFPAQIVGTTSNSQAITLTNTGNASMTVSSIAIAGSASTDFAQTNNCTVIPASQACTITVTFVPTISGTRNAQVTIIDNSPTSPDVVTLTGTAGTPSISLTPATLAFGSQTIGTTSASQIATLTNTGIVTVRINSITTSGAFSQTNNCPSGGFSGMGPGTSCTINLSFTPTATGAAAGTLTVSSSVASSPNTISLSGTGIGPNLSGLPSAVAMSCTINNSCPASQNFTITNTGNATLSVTNASSSSGVFVAQPIGCTSVAVGKTCTLNIQLDGVTAGRYTGVISVFSNAPGSPTLITATGTLINSPHP